MHHPPHTHAAIVALVTISCFALNLKPAHAQPNHRAGIPMVEPLLEAPIQEIPEGMTYEDYKDANRRLGLAFTFAALPGGMHFYADEPTTGWILVGAATIGVAGIIMGAGTAREVPQNPEGDFLTTRIGEKTYYRIPVTAQDGSDASTRYKLEEASSTRQGLTDTGAALVTGGVIALVGAYVWDMYHGIMIIEDKRDRARYKIGTMMSAKKREKANGSPTVGIKPMVDPQNGGGGLQLEMRF